MNLGQTTAVPCKSRRVMQVSIAALLLSAALLPSCSPKPDRFRGPTRSGINSMLGGDGMGGRMLQSGSGPVSRHDRQTESAFLALVTEE